MFESRVDIPPSQKPVFSLATSGGDQASKRDKVGMFFLNTEELGVCLLCRDMFFTKDLILAPHL